jgi:MYXO-CTERM domain-containing protein
MRMFQPLFPVCALGLSVLVQQLWRSSRAATIGLLASCLATSWVWHPVRFYALVPGSRASNLAHTSAFALLALVAVVAAVLVRRRPDGQGGSTWV